LESYVGEGAFDKISESKSSINLPINIPLEETRLFLSHFDLTLHDIYKTLKSDDKSAWIEYLKISPIEFNILSVPNNDDAHNTFAKLPMKHLEDVQEFIRYAGITFF